MRTPVYGRVLTHVAVRSPPGKGNAVTADEVVHRLSFTRDEWSAAEAALLPFHWCTCDSRFAPAHASVRSLGEQGKR